VIPTVSASPAVLNQDNGSTQITMSFDGLPVGYELPQEVDVGFYRIGGTCEKDGVEEINILEEDEFPSHIPIAPVRKISWPVEIGSLDPIALTQNIDALTMFLDRSQLLQEGWVDSCTIEYRALLTVLLKSNEISEPISNEIVDYSHNGLPPHNQLSLSIASQPIQVTLDKSVSVHWN